ncbi:hypothetical protein SCLCIDRAFT_7133 [Scleroderma citrinum Foug A]|uniref:Amino acid permease/ SLC12A domain-containing protein n=1 Tax=Scleroderma citrinum Foug A TaxID=1036808 RepID=A0A0C3EL61_9AGAM|nr:hypothetical protein SCLCIDRAFT_7133 [Scleroderma citrinum Foug A]
MFRRDEIVGRDEELLARLGYKQEFKRAFTPLEVFGLAFSVIGLFPSMTSVLVYGLPNGGPVSMVWGWVVASLFVLCIGMSIAELASAAPTAGGVYYWTHTFASPRWRNLLSWIVGYADTIGYISGLASVDWGCAVQITAAASIGSGQTYVATSAQTFGIFVAVLLSHGLPFRVSTLVLNGMATNYTAGVDASVHISEEASNAAVAVPWAIVHNGFQLGRNVILASVLDDDSQKVVAASRQAFAFSRDGVLPFSSILSRVNKYTRTPVNAVWFVIITAGLLGLLSFAGTQAINAIFSVTVNALYIAYIIPIVSRWLGDNDFKPGPFHLGPFSLPISVIAVLFMTFMNVVFLFPATPSMNYTVVVLGGVFALSIVWYYFPVYGGVHWFTGPVRNVNVGDESSSPNTDVTKEVGGEKKIGLCSPSDTDRGSFLTLGQLL